jgi:hypothetical protein
MTYSFDGDCEDDDITESCTSTEKMERTRCSERHRTKCWQYWPELEGSNVTYGMYNILSENIENYEDFMDFVDFRNPFRKTKIGTNEKGKIKLTRIVQGKELFHLLSSLVKEKVLLQSLSRS